MRVALALVLAAGCASSAERSSEAGTVTPRVDAAATASTAAPLAAAAAPADGTFDLAGLVERTRAAFFRDGSEWVGGARGYEARMDEQGLRLLAIHQPTVDAAPRRATLHLAPTRVRFGDASLSRGTLERSSDGTLAISYGTVTEHWSITDAGAHQSFEIRSAGAGDLVVQVPVSGLELVHSDETGLHFRDPSSGVGVRYGHGTLVDAQGRATPILAIAREGLVELRVPASLLSALPATLDPVVGPEITFGGTTYVAAAGSQTLPRVASLGATGSLVVWKDARRGGADVFAARFSTSGVVLDGVGLPIESGTATPDAADVAAGGGTYLVVWSRPTTVEGSLVSSAGVVGAPFTIASGRSISRARVTFDGTSFLVAWADAVVAGDTDVLGVRVSTAGIVAGSAATLIGGAGTQDQPALACAVPGCIVAYRDTTAPDTGDVRAVRFDSALRAIDATPLAVAVATDRQYDPSVVVGGMGWIVAWSDARPAGGSIRAVTIDAAGSLGTPAAITSARADTSTLISAAGRTFIGWADEDFGAIRVQELSATATPFGPIASPIEASATTASTPALAYDGTRLVVVWTDYSAGAYDVRAARIALTGSVVDPAGVLVTTADERQTAPQASWSGTQWLMVWQQATATTNADIYGARLATDGTPLDTVGFNIVRTTDDDRLGGVACASTTWQVVTSRYRLSGGAYLSDTQTYAVNSSGWISSPQTLSTPYAYDPTIASASTQYVVQWSDGPIYYRRLDASGAPLGGSSSFWPSGTVQYWGSRVTSDGSTYFFAARRLSASPDGFGLATISTAGTASPAAGYGVDVLASAADDYTVAGGAATFLFAWAYQPPSVPERHVAARIFATGATPLGSVIELGGSYADTPRAVWDGSEFFVVWTHAAVQFGDPLSIYSTRVHTDGTIVDPGGTSILDDTAPLYLGSLASDGIGHVLLVYDAYEPSHGGYRVVGRMIDTTRSGSAVLGTACTSSWSCASGFCVDGVCCDGACGAGTPNDCSACSVALGAAMQGHCGPATAGTSCRAATGACDAAEACDGTTTACPADARQPMGTLCGTLATDLCDLDDRCDGVAATCPTSARAPMGTPCRAAVDVCDHAESCDGTHAACPADTMAPTTTTCRPVRGVCDVAERCDGTTPACPADGFAPLHTHCRDTRGVCDPREECDGASPQCPPDVLAPAGAVCRPAVGACDRLEACDGRNAACPADRRLAAGSSCRAAAGPCDAEEVCDGIASACPVDLLRPRGELCRPSTGVCDVAEACDGANALCSDDHVRVDGSSCDDDLICNGVSQCMAGACTSAEPLTCGDGLTCSEPLGRCAPPESAGCGCRVAPHEHRSLAPLAWLALLVLLVRARRLRPRAWMVLLFSAGCVCGPGEMVCGDSCTDVREDRNACGHCGVVCPAGELCTNGVCGAIGATGRPCSSDATCDDGLYCNGAEHCVAGGCRTGQSVHCDDGVACTQDVCRDSASACVAIPDPTVCGRGLCTGRGAEGCDP